MSNQLRVTFVCAICSLLWLTPQYAFAQRATASIAGSVTDSSQSAVPGANVVVRNLDTGVERTVESNGLGYYVLPALPAGPCSITVSKVGFQTSTVTQVVLEVDQNATVNIALKLAALPRR